MASEKTSKWINLDNDEDENLTHSLLLANLLAFYEQTLIFEDHHAAVKPYHISRPLWLFVGHTVTGKEGSSDLIKVARFLERFLSNTNAWSVTNVERILKGTTNHPRKMGRHFFTTS